MTAPDIDPKLLATIKLARERIVAQMGQVVVGQEEAIGQILTAMFAGGHCIIQGPPGTAKTLLVTALSLRRSAARCSASIRAHGPLTGIAIGLPRPPAATRPRRPHDPPSREVDPMKRTSVPAPMPKPAAGISFTQEEPWYTTSVTFRTSLDFDQPISQTESPMGYRPTATYDGPRDWSNLVIDLVCLSDDRAPDAPAKAGDGPLASALDAIQVFGPDRTRPLAVFARADLVIARGTENGFEMDGRGPVISTVERVRLPFAAQQRLVRDGHPYRVTLVALDREGRTMACDDVDGDEAVKPITPRPDPQSGWAIGGGKDR